MRHRIVDSPLGPLTLVVNDSGALQALYMADQKWGPEPDDDLGERDDTVAADAVAQLAEYFAGTRTEFDLALAPVGTDFQRGSGRPWARFRSGRPKPTDASPSASGIREGRAVGAATSAIRSASSSRATASSGRPAG